MKNILSVCKQSKKTGFVAFHFFFFAVMWASKTLHILFFEQSGAMVQFGASYSAMALAGYFSFLIGYLADVVGYRKMLLGGGVLYSIGLILRTFPDSFSVAITSGLVAGAGASCILSALRIWMVELADHKGTAEWVGIKSAASSFGTAAGCAFAGLLPVVLVSFGFADSLQAILAYLGIAMALLTAVFYVYGPRTQQLMSTKKFVTPWAHIGGLLKHSKFLFLMTLILGVTTGFYVSFLTPYLPLMMKEKGFSLLNIGLSTASFALIRFFVDPSIARFVGKNKDHTLKIFLLAELLIALVTGALLWSFSKWVFVLVLVLRSAFLGFSTISEEVLWIRTFPADKIGVLFGLSQSGFFAGDFLGGVINGFLYQNFGLDKSILVVLAIMVINASLFAYFFRKVSAPC